MNLMRKAAFAAIALTAATAFAGPNMFYGAGFGFSQNNSAINSTKITVSSGDATGAKSYLATGGEALQGFGFVGVSGSLSDMISGSVQADLGFDGLSKDVRTAAVTTDGAVNLNLQSGLYYGASARLSVIRGDFAPYLLAGIRAGQWSATYTNTAPNIVESMPVGLVHTKSKTMVSPELGVGINFTYSDAMDGRMEYKYMFGSTASTSIAHPTDGTAMNNSLSARQQSVQFSLVF